jgi:hypothetical protein
MAEMFSQTYDESVSSEANSFGNESIAAQLFLDLNWLFQISRKG